MRARRLACGSVSSLVKEKNRITRARMVRAREAIRSELETQTIHRATISRKTAEDTIPARAARPGGKSDLYPAPKTLLTVARTP